MKRFLVCAILVLAAGCQGFVKPASMITPVPVVATATPVPTAAPLNGTIHTVRIESTGHICHIYVANAPAVSSLWCFTPQAGQ